MTTRRKIPRSVGADNPFSRNPVLVTRSGRGGRPRRRAVVMSVVIHALLPIGLLILPGGFKDEPKPEKIDIVFYTPDVERPAVKIPDPPPPPKPVEVARVEPPPAPKPEPEPRETPPPVVRNDPPKPRVVVQQIEPPKPAVKPEPVPAPPKPKPQTGAFARLEQPAPKPKRTAQVQRLGGFKDDAPAAPTRKKRTRVVASGGFSEKALTVPRQDREPARRTVATAGFAETAPDGESKPAPRPRRQVSSGGFSETASAAAPKAASRKQRTVSSGSFTTTASAATSSGRGSSNGGSVQQGGFGDGAVAAKKTPRRRRTLETPDTPVEIVSKPRPAYTNEAREKRIEGEVVLEVKFDASGRLSVLRVVNGLGHGLDEAAVEATRKIQFKPARRDGQPVDHTATLRVVFRLA